jgi:predicted phage-related endonuclease
MLTDYIDLPDRDAWLAYRSEPGAYRIGASAVGAVLGVSGWQSPTDVWSSHQPGYVPPEPSAAMLDGIAWEPIAIRLYSERTGLRVETHPHRVYRHPSAPWLGSTLDALAHDAGDLVVVEIKTDRTPGAATAWPVDGARVDVVDLESPETCPIPPSYWLQVQTQLACADLERAHVVVCLPRFGMIMPELRVIEVLAQPYDQVLTAVTRWRDEHLVAGVRPDPRSASEREAFARWLYPERPTRRDATPEEADQIARLLELRDQRDAADAAFSEIRSELVLAMRDAAELRAPVGKVAVNKRGVTVTRAK